MSTTALAAVLAKFASLNVAAKAVVGLAVAASAVGVAGGAPAIASKVTGVPAADQVAIVKPAIEPVERTLGGADATSEETETPGDATDVGAQAPAKVEAKVEAEVETGATLPAASAFGQSVAEDARDGGVDGQEISAQARANAELRHATDSLPETPAAEATGADSSAAAVDLSVQGKLAGQAADHQ